LTGEGVDERIHRVALEHLRDRGFSGLSMEGVAAEAGVAKTTLYRRYRNRADLATAALAADVAVLPDPADGADDVRGALVEFMLVFGTRWRHYGLDVFGAMLIERDDPELAVLHRERIINPRRGYALALLEIARERGEIRADVDLGLALEAMIGSFMVKQMTGRPLDPDSWAREIVDLLWEGLGSEGT
jgi:AcrR family transcriptional regulator